MTKCRSLCSAPIEEIPEHDFFTLVAHVMRRCFPSYLALAHLAGTGRSHPRANVSLQLGLSTSYDTRA